jgi:hypothetical protein
MGADVKYLPLPLLVRPSQLVVQLIGATVGKEDAHHVKTKKAPGRGFTGQRSAPNFLNRPPLVSLLKPEAVEHNVATVLRARSKK